MSSTLYFQYLSIAHRKLSFFHPLSVLKFDEAIEKLNLKPNHEAVDFGGGKGEFVIKLIERYKVRGTVVERPGSSAAEVMSRAKGRIPIRKIRVNLNGVEGFLAESEAKKFDLVSCINSVALGTNFRKILDGLRKTTKPGGLIVVGIPYWKGIPTKAFLKHLNILKSDLATHTQFIRVAENKGLIPLWASLASQDEIDTYEWSTSFEIENYVDQNKKTKDNESLLEFARENRRIFLSLSRECWGFGLYVFRNRV